MKRSRWMSAYVLTAGLGLGLAYAGSLALLPKARSQAPELPAAPPGAPAAEPSAGDPNLTPPAPPPPPPAPPAATAGAPSSATAVGGEDYVYDPTGRRDPFKPYRQIGPKPVVKSDVKGPEEGSLEPLQRFDLDQLSVIGILWDVRQPRALVRDSEGKVHTLVKNTKVGRNSGYVAAIREGEVVVIETFDEEGGTTVKRARSLEFRRKE